MIGLPGETMEDVLAIADLARQVKYQGKRTGRGGEVNVSVSSFVPKAHTPFQWEPQISYEEILTKQEMLRTELKKRKLNFKWQDAPLSVMEGVFARGDRRLGRVLVEAMRRGCRFDGWGEHFRFHTWLEAFAAVGIDPRFYLRARQLDEPLPWDHLDAGVNREFLRRERELALTGTATADCRGGDCSACGVCDFREIRMRPQPDSAEIPQKQATPPAATGAELPGEQVRIKFSKTGPMRYLSHLELITLFTRAVGRAGIPIRFSQGFHPHPKFSFATALSVGVESWAEYLDLELSPGFGADRVKSGLNAVLPEGMAVLEAWPIPPKSPSLSVIMTRVRYRVSLPEGSSPAFPEQAAAFLALATFPYCREKQKGGVQEFDLRQGLHSLTITGRDLELEIDRAKPLEYVAAITGLSLAQLADCRIAKLEVIFKDSSQLNI
jgi:radical SAM-linked protein